MESMVKTGDDETHIGIPICEGPGQFRMVLTRPYHEAGHIIEIPRENIASVEPVAPGSLGDAPAPAG
jgi:hypothetical protein